jgi:hypothetical protein
MKDIIAKLKAEIANCAVNFKTYIADTKIPLEDRWEVFCDAPAVLKREDDYGGFPPIFQKMGWDAIDSKPFYLYKHETMNMADAVQRLEVERSPDDKVTDKLIMELKEEILAANIGFVVMDW